MERDYRRPLLIAAIAALSLTALISIIALLAGDFGDTELRILATTGGFGLSSLLAMRGTTLLEQQRHLLLGRAVVGMAALAFLCELWILWVDNDSEAAWKSYVCTIAITAALAQIAGMLSSTGPNDPPSLTRLIWAAGVAAVIVAGMACLAALAEISSGGYYRLFGVVVVLDAFLVALQPIIRRLERRAPAQSTGSFTLVLDDGRRTDHGGGPSDIAAALRDARGRVIRIEFGDG